MYMYMCNCHVLLSVARVVQKNLVFAVGLSQRLGDVEMLKKHDYFGKFGKIVKVVINQTTSYAGSQVRTAMFTACSHLPPRSDEEAHSFLHCAHPHP